MHDAAHMMLLKTKIMNDVAGTICASLVLMNYNAWKIKLSANILARLLVSIQK
jgi:fatty acid desaturase